MSPLQEAEALLEVVSPYDTASVIKAYKKKCKVFHPDHGGTSEQFIRLKSAKELVISCINKRGAPGRAPAQRAKQKTEAQRPRSAEWYRRQHSPWNSRDQRSSHHASAGAVFEEEFVDPSDDPTDDSPNVFLGDHIRILHLFCGVVELVGAEAWAGQIVQRASGVCISFQPDKPIDRFDYERITCVFTLSGDDEILSLEGPIIERCHDAAGRVTMFCADLLQTD